MKKLFSILTVLVLIMVFSVSAFAQVNTPDTQKALESGITTDRATDTIVSVLEAKDDNILKSDIKSFKGKFADLFTQLNQYRTECKDLWSQIKASNQSIKTAWSSFKESLAGKTKEEKKQILSDLKAKVEPIRTQIKGYHDNIITLRAQKKVEWVNFRSAVKAKDEAKATTALNNIISFKKQIIEKQKSILPLKQQLLESIK